ncbi:MAG: hypothetical protein JWN70_5352 [Planctomycetaceae bacterium]|nr:hypothetical protein [Planctomycetaceae bacterium]
MVFSYIQSIAAIVFGKNVQVQRVPSYSLRHADAEHPVDVIRGPVAPSTWEFLNANQQGVDSDSYDRLHKLS